MPTEFDAWLLQNADWIRIFVFVLLIAGLSFWEAKDLNDEGASDKKNRWFVHLSLSFSSKLITRLMFSLPLVYVAWIAQQDHKGLLNEYPAPIVLKIIIGCIFLDFIIYMQHRLMHKWKWFWRIHQAHHLDMEIDVSTGIRFHPIEEMISLVIKMMAVIFMGVPVLGVLIFEILLSFASLFTHTNIEIPFKVDAVLRRVIVTPAMHRVHHTIETEEQNSNFGFFFSIWDKLFGTYQYTSIYMEHKIIYGLSERRGAQTLDIIYLLLHPFNLKKYKQPKKKPLKVKIRAFE